MNTQNNLNIELKERHQNTYDHYNEKYLEIKEYCDYIFRTKPCNPELMRIECCMNTNLSFLKIVIKSFDSFTREVEDTTFLDNQLDKIIEGCTKSINKYNKLRALDN